MVNRDGQESKLVKAISDGKKPRYGEPMAYCYGDATLKRFRQMYCDRIAKLSDCQIQADTAFVNEKLVFWAAAVLIVGMWVVLAYLSYLAVCDGL